MIKINSLQHLLELLSFGGVKEFYIKKGDKFKQMMFVEKIDNGLDIFFFAESKSEMINIEDLKIVKEHNILNEIERSNLFMVGM